MSEIQPALLTRNEIEWLLGKTCQVSKKTERDLRYRINKKVKIFMQAELPLLKDRGLAAAISNDAAAISSGGTIGEPSLAGRGVANQTTMREEARGVGISCRLSAAFRTPVSFRT